MPVVMMREGGNPDNNGRQVRGLADDLNDLRRLLNHDYVRLLLIGVLLSIVFRGRGRLSHRGREKRYRGLADYRFRAVRRERQSFGIRGAPGRCRDLVEGFRREGRVDPPAAGGLNPYPAQRPERIFTTVPDEPQIDGELLGERPLAICRVGPAGREWGARGGYRSRRCRCPVHLDLVAVRLWDLSGVIHNVDDALTIRPLVQIGLRQR
jgi:hypothetical protein